MPKKKLFSFKFFDKSGKNNFKIKPLKSSETSTAYYKTFTDESLDFKSIEPEPLYEENVKSLIGIDTEIKKKFLSAELLDAEDFNKLIGSSSIIMDVMLDGKFLSDEFGDNEKHENLCRCMHLK